MMYHAICSKNNVTLGIGEVVILRAGEQLIRLQMMEQVVVWGETIMFSEWGETGDNGKQKQISEIRWGYRSIIL